MKKLLAILFFGFALAVPTAHAQSNLPLFNPNFTIVPQQCTQCPCGYAGTLQLVQNLMNLGIALGLLIMILVVVYAGALFLFSPTNPGNREMGKSMLTNAVIGIVIVLSAWLIVDAIMKSLYDAEAKWGPWNTIIGTGGEWCIEAQEVEPIYDGSNLGKPASGGGEGGVGVGSGGGGAGVDPSTASRQEAAVRSLFASYGITVNKSACTENQTSNCTNVGGLQNSTIQHVINVKKACACSLVVTGGSEPGHAMGTLSHGTGYKVDFRLGPGINSFIEGKLFKAVNYNGPYPVYGDKCGNFYVKEGDHWDVGVLQACSLP